MKIISCTEQTMHSRSEAPLTCARIEVKVGKIFLLFTKFNNADWFLQYTSACSWTKNEDVIGDRYITAPYFITWLDCQIEEYKTMNRQI